MHPVLLLVVLPKFPVEFVAAAMGSPDIGRFFDRGIYK
jgi:hypothetical protein